MTRASRVMLAILLCPCAVTAAEDESAPPYVQASVIEPGEGRGVILGFCVPTGGGLVAVTGPRPQYGAAPMRLEAAQSLPHRLVWFAADGAEIRSIDLDFAATVAGAGPGGRIYVAGDGVVARLSPEGEEEARGPTPHGPKTDEEREQLEKSVTDAHEAQVAAAEKQVERLRGALAELQKKVAAADAAAAAADEEQPDEEESDEDRRLRQRREASLRSMRSQVPIMAVQVRQREAQVNRLRKLDVTLLVEQALRKPRQVRAISATRDAVFLVTPEPIGFGYALWRLDERLGDPEKIVSGLRGCCSQMDVQVCGEKLAIAVNTKHCVELRDFAGESLGTVGRRAGGDDANGFGGCCNPMNTCMAPDGCLLTSESDGVVKRFDADGGFVEVVGKARVKPGCKNSAIAIEPDGSRIYYMNVEHGNVIVLERAEGRDADETVEDPEAPSRRGERT